MILTLCGSARFEPAWHEANKQLGLAGHICFSLMTFASIEGEKSWYTPAQKRTLELAHLAKIEASDGVVMLNLRDVSGEPYLGESSLRELEWARMRGKRIFWTYADNRQMQRHITGHPYREEMARTLLGLAPGEWTELQEIINKE